MNCDWNDPGHMPYRQHGIAHIEKALTNYKYPHGVYSELLWKIKTGQSDAVVFIGRDGVDSYYGTASNLRNMHSKTGMCTGSVQRNSWKPEHTEPALVYCASSGDCVSVPVVCGNVSQLDYTRREKRNNSDFVPQEFPVVNTVPEPSVYLLALGLLGIFQIRKNKIDKSN